MNLSDLIERNAAFTPDKAALRFGGRVLTYAAFWDRIVATSRALKSQLGVGRGDRVAILATNHPDYLVLLYACARLGAILVPLNWRLAVPEQVFILADASVKALVVEKEFGAVVPPLIAALPDIRIVGLDFAPQQGVSFDGLLAGGSGDGTNPHVDESCALLLVYTSGTTGRPKGAVLSHKNLLFMSQCYYADIDLVDERDTHLLAAPVSHGAGLYALPFVLKGGHQIVLPHFDVADILEVIREHPRVSMFAAPTMRPRLAHAPEVAGADLANLKTIYYGGGPMYVADLEKALQLFGPRLYQLFGQGESPMTITGLSQRLHAESSHPRWKERLGSCGVPRTGVLVRVVDDNDDELPPGEVGEVVTSSDCVMEGYWENPAANAETLRGGWLHTGDLGRIDEDGFLTLRDRSKDMIISGGSNIYPREIEEVLLRHPSVVEAAIVGRPHPEWGEEVVAFVVAKSGAQVEKVTLDRLCLDHIARFKRPRDYRFVDSLPKNNYGKVLKTELRRLLAEGAGKTNDDAAG